MNGTLILCIALAYFVLGYWLYGGFISRLFGVDPNRATPAKTKYDGVDYVPMNSAVLFGHHFASIAGAGPIVGPIMAAYFGWLPALLWILIGCVFIGAVHDFAALFLSVRNDGKSIGFIIERFMGFYGRQLFLAFCWACLILVLAMFGLMVADTFVKTPSVATASVLFIFIAPIFGYLTRHVMSLRIGSFIFVPLVFFIVWLSTKLPIDLVALFGVEPVTAMYIWIAFLGLYVFIASVMPVEWLLTPRDYLNSYILYAMLFAGILGVFVTCPDINLPAFTGFTAKLASGDEQNMFPTLFILIACGACSGFHSLVASGETSKQLRSESHMQMIGYGAMIIEGVLGVLALITVMYLPYDSFVTIGKNPVMAFASGIGAFMSKLGIDNTVGVTFISLAISAFMLTTLDTATRICRFVWQEMFSPSYYSAKSSENETKKDWRNSGFVHFISNSYVASTIAVFSAAFMLTSGSAAYIWPVFGAANQLLSAITLLAITMYLMTKRMNYWITIIPTIFMMIMSIWGLISIMQGASSGGIVIVGSSVFLIIMSVLLIALSVIIFIKHVKEGIKKARTVA